MAGELSWTWCVPLSWKAPCLPVPPLYTLVKGKGFARALRPALDLPGVLLECPARQGWSFNKEGSS